jgi:hypothetical protein
MPFGIGRRSTKENLGPHSHLVKRRVATVQGTSAISPWSALRSQLGIRRVAHAGLWLMPLVKQARKTRSLTSRMSRAYTTVVEDTQ